MTSGLIEGHLYPLRYCDTQDSMSHMGTGSLPQVPTLQRGGAMTQGLPPGQGGASLQVLPGTCTSFPSAGIVSIAQTTARISAKVNWNLIFLCRVPHRSETVMTRVREFSTRPMAWHTAQLRVFSRISPASAVYASNRPIVHA